MTPFAKRYGLLQIAAWTLMLGVMLGLTLYVHHQDILREALLDARNYYRLNLHYRSWNAGIGGLYAPVEKVAPNPYLALPGRDITTDDQRRLTLVNPAYMSRMIFEQIRADSATPIINKLTSLKPLNPANAPDAWEREALMAFERTGSPDIYQVIPLNDAPYMRFISRFVTEKNCLVCHATQGYELGDIRGGISIALPLTPYFIAEARTRLTITGGYMLLWVSGSTALAMVSRKRHEQTAALEAEVVERQIAQDALCDSEGRFRILLESVTDYIYTTHVEEGIPGVTTHGPGCAAVTGYSAEEFASDPELWFRMVPEEDRAAVLKQADAVLAGKELSALEHRITLKDGRICWIRNTPVPRHNQQGRLIAFDGIVTDVTDLKNLGIQLLQSQKMEAIGQLAGGIAHDFNNILTAIIGFSTIIEMNMEKDDPQRANLSSVLAAADRAADLTRSLLTFSRKQIIDPQTVDLNQIIRKIDKFLQRIIGEDIALNTTFGQDVIAVNADSGQIEQVLMNLATNARDAMPDGGLLSLETGTVEVDAEYIKAHGYGDPGRYACISVSDSGNGMDESTCKKVFEPFFTTKEVGKGTGLGLSIVFGIVKQHNGFINVYSEPGAGTTFRILLPLIQSAVVEKYTHNEELLEQGAATILVADDDAALRELAEKVLTMFGYTVIVAVDGSDAVARFKANRDRIDLVILDIIMPEMNGKEAFDEMRKLNPAVKGMFISGYTSDIIQKRGLMEHGLDFIAKPLNLKHLLTMIRDVLGEGA